MKDWKISKKHQPAVSLGWRILTVSIFLLVIPLILQSFFLYRHEYQEKLEDIKDNLEVLAKERAHFIKEDFQLKWTLITFARLNNETTIYSGYGESKPFVIEKIPVPQGLDDHFIIVDQRRNAVLVGEKDSNAAYVIAIPFGNLIKNLGTIYPVRLALLDKEGNNLAENMKIRADKNCPCLLQIKEPIGKTNFYLELTIPQSYIDELHKANYYFRFASLVFFVGLIGGGSVYLLTRRISKPLNNLCRTMERVSEGASHARYTPDRMGFEINALGKQFNETMDALLSHVQEIERERTHRERLAEELKIGHQIQASLFPSHLPGLPGVDLAADYLPAKEVNGDFYDLLQLENGKVLIVMSDTAGKGISACIYSLGLRSALRSFATLNPDLSEIVMRANDLFWLDVHETGMFSTLWIALFDPKDGRMTYCSQGHPPALLRRGDRLEELWTGGIALGAQKMDVIPTKEIVLAKDDLLLLYTDGIIEAHDVDNQLFGMKRLNEFLLRKKHENAQQIADHLIEEVELFSNGAPQHDDMTVIVWRIV